MEWYHIVGIVVATLILLTLAIAFYCYRRVFYSPDRKPLQEDEYAIPPGEIYEEFREQLVTWMQETRAMPYQRVSIQSHDGLTLRGKYYEYKKGAPLEILFHGYKCDSESGLSGGVQRCFALGRNALLVDQRANGESDGHVISFGVNEHKDCLRWIDFAIETFGKEQKILLGGVSMGAATVLMAAGKALPDNVICVLADCGYSSQKEIIKKVVREMHLPPVLVYPFIKLGARLFGHFNLEEITPLEAVKNCKIPAIFFHGDDDAFIPYQMSEDLYNVCTSPKRLVYVKGAGHGLAFPKDKDGYIEALQEFKQAYL